MTTIVADAARGVMVSDSRNANDSTKWPCRKIERIGGHLYGFAGDDACIYKMTAWFRRNRAGKKPKTKDGFECIELRPDAIYYWADNNDIAYKIERSFHAAGSGCNAALGAVLAGVSVEKAVEIACQVDAESEGPVVVEKLHAAA